MCSGHRPSARKGRRQHAQRRRRIHPAGRNGLSSRSQRQDGEGGAGSHDGESPRLDQRRCRPHQAPRLRPGRLHLQQRQWRKQQQLQHEARHLLGGRPHHRALVVLLHARLHVRRTGILHRLQFLQKQEISDRTFRSVQARLQLREPPLAHFDGDRRRLQRGRHLSGRLRQRPHVRHLLRP